MNINKNDYQFFYRTFAMFDVKRKEDQGATIFTFPQFVATVWNFLTMDLSGLGEWTFRAYFGGIECSSYGTANLSEVFHLVDIVYGVSQQGAAVGGDSDLLQSVFHTGNSVESDVQRINAMIQKCAEDENEMDVVQFTRMTKQTPELLARLFSVQLELRERIGGNDYWSKKSKKRGERAVGKKLINWEFDEMRAKVEEIDSKIFDMPSEEDMFDLQQLRVENGDGNGKGKKLWKPPSNDKWENGVGARVMPSSHVKHLDSHGEVMSKYATHHLDSSSSSSSPSHRHHDSHAHHGGASEHHDAKHHRGGAPGHHDHHGGASAHHSSSHHGGAPVAHHSSSHHDSHHHHGKVVHSETI